MVTQSMSVQVPVGPGPDAEQLPAHLWTPSSGTGPGLVLFQEIFGVSAYIRARAADLAELGYVVLAPEFFFRLGVSALEPDVDDVLAKAMGLAGRLDWPQTVGDGVAAFDWLRGRPEVSGGAGLIGFCFGGGLAFAVAADTEPDVLVSYYGSALPDLLDRAGDVTAPSLHHFGLADSYLQPEVVERIRGVIERPGVRIETYPGAEHAFDGPMPGLHNADASARAWQISGEFLLEHLPVGDGGVTP